MKKLIAVVLVMGLIFGVTYITQFTGTDVAPKDVNKESGVGPLLWGAQSAKRDTTSSEPHYRFFPGFYEVNVESSVFFLVPESEAGRCVVRIQRGIVHEVYERPRRRDSP